MRLSNKIKTRVAGDHVTLSKANNFEKNVVKQDAESSDSPTSGKKTSLRMPKRVWNEDYQEYSKCYGVWSRKLPYIGL